MRELGLLTKSFDSGAGKEVAVPTPTPTPSFSQDRFRVSAKFDEKHVKGGEGGAWNVLF